MNGETRHEAGASGGSTFSGRWGMMLAMLGMAVGTGNIWRFPRIAATNGGGDFLIPWVVFLLIWSIPLILTEFALGTAMRRGPVGGFGRLLGPRFAWMGGWVAFCATAIMFYYSVVTGWCIRYVWAAVAGEIPAAEPGAFWAGFTTSAQPLATHVLALGVATFVVWRGVSGIERAARVLMPALFALVLLLALRAVTLPGAERGLAFLFTPDWGRVRDAEVWLNALTQNAWDTGAGWGLIVSYAVYMRAREDTTLNAFMLGFGNNSVSLLAGIMVLCTVFSIRPDAAGEIVGAGNTGLTFIWMPQLFATIPLGRLFMGLFFLALLFAALTSLISMVELAVRALTDAGLSRGRALPVVAAGGLLFGVPSALSVSFLDNQDFVWGVGLMLSGFLFAFAVLRHGVDAFRVRFVNSEGSDFTIGRWWNWAMRLVALEAVVLMVWWFYQSVRGQGWREALDPFSSFNLGTLLVQWAVVLALLLLANRWLGREGAAVAPGAAPLPAGSAPGAVSAPAAGDDPGAAAPGPRSPNP